MEENVKLVAIAIHRPACHGSIEMRVLAKINEPTEVRLCHDQSYADECILISDL